MDEAKTLEETFIKMYYLMQRYHLLWYRTNLGGLDPQQGQGRILTALRRVHKMNQKDLGNLLNIRPQSLGELLHKLEANDYIRRYHSTQDKRSLIVELTEKGETFQLQKPDYEDFFKELDEEECAKLQSSLKKISEHLDELIREEMQKDEYDLYTE